MSTPEALRTAPRISSACNAARACRRRALSKNRCWRNSRGRRDSRAHASQSQFQNRSGTTRTASAPLPTLQACEVLLRRRHRLLEPLIDHRGDLVIVILLHHDVAVALDSEVGKLDEGRL